MKNLKRQNPGQLFVAQELINKVIKLNYSVAELRYNTYLCSPFLSVGLLHAQGRMGEYFFLLWEG